MLEQSLVATALGVLLTVAWSDLNKRRIPNWTCGALAAVAVVRLLLAGDAVTAALAVAIAGAAFAPLALAFALGRVGGGDVKLLTACVLLAGPAGTPTLLIATALAGGAMALVALVPAPKMALDRLTRHRFAGEGLPYGVAIAAGAALSLLQQMPPPTA